MLTAPVGNSGERVTVFPTLTDNGSLCLAPTAWPSLWYHVENLIVLWFDLLFTSLLMLLAIGLDNIIRFFSYLFSFKPSEFALNIWAMLSSLSLWGPWFLLWLLRLPSSYWTQLAVDVGLISLAGSLLLHGEHQLPRDSPQTSHSRSSLEKLTCHSLILSGSLFLAVHRQASMKAFFRRTRGQCQSLRFLCIGPVHLPVVSCHPNRAVFVLAAYYLWFISPLESEFFLFRLALLCVKVWLNLHHFPWEKEVVKAMTLYML